MKHTIIFEVFRFVVRNITSTIKSFNSSSLWIVGIPQIYAVLQKEKQNAKKKFLNVKNKKNC